MKVLRTIALLLPGCGCHTARVDGGTAQEIAGLPYRRGMGPTRRAVRRGVIAAQIGHQFS